MHELRVRLDPQNPGQFFACCGLLELLQQGDEHITARFEAAALTPRRAVLVVEGSAPPDLCGMLERLRSAQYECLPGSEKSVQAIRIRGNGIDLVLDWWLDVFHESTTRLKCWAGQVTTAKLFTDLPPLIDPNDEAEIFQRKAMTRSKLGVDPRSAWNALDFGFSPDVHNRESATYPIVEVLAAVGLQGFRPQADGNGASYHLWTSPLPASVARLAAVAGWEGLPCARYRFEIAKRGQSYKYFTFARCEQRESYD